MKEYVVREREGGICAISVRGCVCMVYVCVREGGYVRPVCEREREVYAVRAWFMCACQREDVCERRNVCLNRETGCAW